MTATTPTVDIVIVAHTFQLCRSGTFRRGAEVMEQLARDFPGEDLEVIRLSALDAATRMKAQYND